MIFPEYDVRYIAVNDNVDTLKAENKMMVFRNVFNDFYARDCSKKVKAVYRAKGMSGKPLASRPPYGYKKSEHDKNVWEIDGVTRIPDPIPADVVKRNRELEQRQRKMERNIRKLKRYSEGTCDPDSAKAYRRELREEQKRLREFVTEHEEVLRRDYSREKVYSGGLTNGQKSDIIKSGSEAMYRKAKDGKIEPMPKKQLRKIVKCFKKQGGLIQMDEETDKYLEKKQVEGITYNAKIILLKRNPGRASVFEELIHTAQYRDGKNDGSYKSRLICEIEAQKKLIANAEAYKLTESEVDQTKIVLRGYEEDLEAYYKNGGG